MYWTDLKRGLLYGQPVIQAAGLPAQDLKMAMRDITRLVQAGWIEHLSDDAVQRIRSACHVNQCVEIWEKFQAENPLLFRPKRGALRVPVTAKSSASRRKSA